jgi:hypothetical protein
VDAEFHLGKASFGPFWKWAIPWIKGLHVWKDVVLYALGVGAGFSDLDYCYEKDLKVIPSFSIAIHFR